MRKSFGAKPLTYPQPVYILAAYAADGTPDVMNAAWGGISDDKEISVHKCRPQDDKEYTRKQGIYHKYGGREESRRLRLRRYRFGKFGTR